MTVGIPVLVGFGCGAELDTATKVTSAITMTAASALTIIQGSLELDDAGVGADTETPHRNGLRDDADPSFSVFDLIFRS